MRWSPAIFLPLAVTSLSHVSVHAEAKIFTSIEQAQKRIFPGQTLKKTAVILTEAQTEKMRAASSVRHPFRGDRVWQTSDNGWFIVDEVLGKHEMIVYAMGISADGTIKEIEILEYHESYGYQVDQESWRQQFVGKNSTNAIKLGTDIKNISGATLSCKHVTDGVKRIMVMHDMILRPLHVK
jgi:Na+-translocating ferredoxin:NAD+ oxidoreductase RnfG subunit